MEGMSGLRGKGRASTTCEVSSGSPSGKWPGSLSELAGRPGS